MKNGQRIAIKEMKRYKQRTFKNKEDSQIKHSKIEGEEWLKFRWDVGLNIKSLEALKLDNIRVKKQNRRSQPTSFETGRFEFQKRSGFLKGEHGRQVVVYIEGELIVGLVSFQVISYV